MQAADAPLTLETDKVSTGIPAAISGKLAIQVKEGGQVKIG